MSEPFAVEMYRQYLSGKTVPQISADTGIPANRIEARIRAAARYLADAKSTSTEWWGVAFLSDVQPRPV